jgi:hypothetical protein
MIELALMCFYGTLILYCDWKLVSKHLFTDETTFWPWLDGRPFWPKHIWPLLIVVGYIITPWLFRLMQLIILKVHPLWGILGEVFG